MKDEQIIKALENMQYGGHSCADCKFGTMKGYERCGIKGCIISRQAALLINRQKAEIERLEFRCDDCDRIGLTRSEYKTCIKQAKSEAIKEFAERLKETIIQENDLYVRCAKNMLSEDFQRGYEEKNDSFVEHIDTLVKETVGEQ